MPRRCICGHNETDHGPVNPLAIADGYMCHHLGCRCDGFVLLGSGLEGGQDAFEQLTCTGCRHPAAMHTGADLSCDVLGCGCHSLVMGDNDWQVYNSEPPREESVQTCEYDYPESVHFPAVNVGLALCNCNFFRVRGSDQQPASLRICGGCGHPSHLGVGCSREGCNCIANAGLEYDYSGPVNLSTSRPMPPPTTSAEDYSGESFVPSLAAPPLAQIRYLGQPVDQGLIPVGNLSPDEGYAEIRCGNTLVRIGCTELQRAVGGVSIEFEHALYAITAEAMLGRTPNHRVEPKGRPDRCVDLTPLRETT